MRTLSRYPKYKPSGVEWLGDVPEHWKVRQLKRAAKCFVSNVDKVVTANETAVRMCNYTDVYYHDQIRPDMGLMETTATLQEIHRFGLQVGDVLITKDSEDWRDIGVPALIVESAPDLVCGYHLAIVRPVETELVGAFLLRALQASVVNQQFQVAATGVTRFGLPKSSIGEAILPLPPRDEQRAIADFLDREITKIDTLVAKKYALIDRLKEKRAALISRTVTRGLPPDAARSVGLEPRPNLKPTDIDWLGDVPEHWKVRQLKRAAKCFVSNVDKVVTANETAVRMCNYTDVYYHDQIRPDMGLMETTATLQEIHRFGLQVGDVLITKDSEDWRDIGVPALIVESAPDLVCGYHLAIVRPVETELVGAFLLRALQASVVNQQFQVAATGVTRFGLPKSSIGEAILPLPPRDEQRAIADFLDRETTKIDGLITKIESAIERLLEYRSAAITAVITGRFDVREETA